MNLDTSQITYQSFSERTKLAGVFPTRQGLETLQINVGKLCNQSCSHCHVGAGPAKLRENMNQETAERLVSLAAESSTLKVVDITGGAPELNPNFRYLVRSFRSQGLEVIDRCNLTVLLLEGQEDTAEFLAENQVTIVASLPCYGPENVDKQRGDGVFEDSISALRRLNSLGYGKGNPSLKLNLVYNPVGPHLPPDQGKLQADYKSLLKERFGIDFDQLFCITNMPISRFLQDLKRQGRELEYMNLLKANFSPSAARGVMCRSLVSISWDGQIFDCDFNQMLGLPIPKSKNVWEVDALSDLTQKKIVVADHCFGCTAGAGSSCTGTTA